MVPHVEDTAQGLKLALAGSIRDGIVDADTLALNALEFLNSTNPLAYQTQLGVTSPITNIHSLLEALSHRFGPKDSSSGLFVKLFRQGAFGTFTLDNLPEVKEDSSVVSDDESDVA
eukprot:c18687_g1_i2.p2 GENE.c18687_g1_i2~~c18687_g1_i2.p2  ORF type:complete len:116 (+),score=31.13 c18687_g1_i2:692-1039(+)